MSSKLLIDEPPLQVLPTLAVAVGLNEALVLQQVHYWIEHKKRDKEKYASSYMQERWWIFNSLPEWERQFPFWSGRTLQRIIASLREQGVLLVEQLSGDLRDRTNWYAIDYDHLNSLTFPSADPPPRQSGVMHDDNLSSWNTTERRDGQGQGVVVQGDKVASSYKVSETSSENTTKTSSETVGGSLSLLEQEKHRRNVSSLTREHLCALCREHGWPRVSADMRAVLDALAAQGQPTARPLTFYRELEAEWRQKKTA